MYAGPLAAPASLSAQESLAADGIDIPLGVAILGLSVLGYALVNSIEIAVVAADRIRVRHLAEAGSRGAQALERIRQRQDQFFAVIVLLQNLFVVLGSAVASVIAVQLAGGLGIVVAIAGITVVIALFGEITPKILATQATERYAVLVAQPTEWLILLLRPAVQALTALPSLLGRALFGTRPTAAPTVTQAELRMLIDIGTEEGAVEKAEGDLLERAFALGERRVNEVMVPRTEVVALEKGTTIADFYRVFAQTLHSRFPVYDESLDTIVGIVAIKDVMRAVATDQVTDDSPVEACMRPAMFVPQTKLMDDLLREMQRAGQQMAVVVDEFGGTAGIVTLEMLLEEMVGEVRDEVSRAEKEFEAVDEQTLEVDGGMSVHDANRELDLHIPEGGYETVAGFVLDQLGHIPREGEMVRYNSLRLMVARMQGRKIQRVWVSKPQS
ncbi:MAG: hemolysin family protein [Dehalococcoidia bacterium]